jgi:Protein of unknown function (DUF2924)
MTRKMIQSTRTAPKVVTTSATVLSSQLAELPHLPMPDLWALWDEHFKQRPAHHHRPYLESRLAYKLQESALGGLPMAIRRKLEKIGETGLIPGQDKQADSRLMPGTTLVREFNGLTHRVTVLPDGRFEYLGHPYKSLSAVARVIAGTPWSGPVFFNLKATARKSKTSREVSA